MRAPIPTAILIVLAAGLLAGCSASGSASPAPGSAGTGAIAVSDAWVRPAAQGGTSAAYLTITNGGAADRLLSATSPDAMGVQLHETMTGSSGMTGMQPVDGLDVAAGGQAKLEPGGYHLMLMGLNRALAVGDRVALTLVFEKAGPVVVEAEVRQG